MTIDAVDSSSDEEIGLYLDWALQTGIWDGRPVSWIEASEFHEEVQARIFQRLVEDPESSFAVQLTQIANLQSSDLTLLARDIQELRFSNSDMILQVGLGKSLRKFWKKHKAEILIGAAIAAVITVAVVVSISTAGAGAAASGAALGALPDNKSKSKDKKKEPPSAAAPPPALPSASPATLEPSHTVKPEPPSIILPPLSDSQMLFTEAGIAFQGTFTPYRHIVHNRFDPRLSPCPTSHIPLAAPLSPSQPLDASRPAEPPCLVDPPRPNLEPSWLSSAFSMIGKHVIDNPDLFDFNAPEPRPEVSMPFTIPGKTIPHMQVFGINGINTTMDTAVSHAEYLSRLGHGLSVDWVYNRSHGAVVDLFEVFTLNYSGTSPHTAQILMEQITAFHQNNLDCPDAKALLICFSQGAIHTRNALIRLPKEVRNRVIVVAIAPGAIVPKALCYRSHNYASAKDIVPYGETVGIGLLDVDESEISRKINDMKVLREELILLDPHPGATGIDHDFQSPTFKNQIREHVEDYIQKGGIYQ